MRLEGPVGVNIPRDRPAPLPQLIGTNAPVGIEDAMEELSPWFLDDIDDPRPRFLAIVGFGGLGKTTLAMALYREFGDKFAFRASVLASQKFHLPTVLRSLVKQLHKQQSAAYLILMDDIWSVSAWESIKDSFPNIGKGGRIVVTTRFKSVAEACRRQQAGYVYEHKPLIEENSSKLFRQVISSIGYEICLSKPIDDGIIMKTCGGLPLAIILVAGLVASKLESDKDQKLDPHLAEVSKNLSQELGNNLTTEGVTHILNHCYHHLPADLKTCLLYLSMFPKGCLISRKRLIRRWVAEGFIAEKHGKTVEEVAEDCFNELIGRNLVRAVNNSSNGKVKTCQIHDMVLEYIVSKSSDENFITIVGGHWQTPFPTYKVRRLSIHKSGRKEKDTIERMKLSHVRSLTALGSFKALHSTLLKFQILQVLDLEGCKDLSFNHLKEICKMHQLKFLSLRSTDIERIPKKIGRLECLEVLDIRETKVKKMPPSVERLQRMAHLLAGDKRSRVALKLSEGITKMTALQTLCGVRISTGLALAALENLTNLKKFTIYKLKSFTKRDDELLLSAIEHLSSCSLKFLAIDDDFTGFLDKSLNALQAPPEHLHTLGLSAPVLPPLSFMEGAMQGLQKIEMRFRMVEGVYGLENLSSIRQVVMTVSSQAPEDTKAKVSQIKKLASMIHATVNVPSVVIDEYNESVE
nr:unnamed protein product [Digitaria exilis]